VCRLDVDADDGESAIPVLPDRSNASYSRRSFFFRLITECRSERRATLGAPLTGMPVLSSGTVVGAQASHGLRVRRGLALRLARTGPLGRLPKGATKSSERR
jgi:hypothetical protein